MSGEHSSSKNRLINPPQSGRWIIVSEDNPHRIDIYDNGNKIKEISSFSTGGKWKGIWHHTPVGKFTVLMKDKNHRSSIYHHASMPFYVNFYTSVGFHGGDPKRVSHGCIHLSLSDAEWIYNWSDISKYTINVWVMSRSKQ